MCGVTHFKKKGLQHWPPTSYASGKVVLARYTSHSGIQPTGYVCSPGSSSGDSGPELAVVSCVSRRGMHDDPSQSQRSPLSCSLSRHNVTRAQPEDTAVPLSRPKAARAMEAEEQASCCLPYRPLNPKTVEAVQLIRSDNSKPAPSSRQEHTSLHGLTYVCDSVSSSFVIAFKCQSSRMMR